MIELINSDMLAAQLLAIPQNIRSAIETKAMREAEKLLVGELRAATPEETGALKKSYTGVTRKYQGGNVIVGLAGADYDYVGTVSRNKTGKKTFKRDKNAAAGNRRRPAKYLHFIERGTKRGVNATNFLKKTAERLAGQFQQILENAVQEALNK